ncbi:MAG: SUMF1/EgtB/PvdO family nonheme iron enzyme [Candidatus Omnitrophica bacterium]|nr:SUMF1/EgtB/PvdO family nonheme iron enzyme [Candidatus Omnitrophota bacterium]
MKNRIIQRQRYKNCVFFFCCLLFVFCFLIDKTEANNLNVSNVSLGNVSLGQATAVVQFDISWDNSWRTNTNYDAAWIFVKYSTNAGASWNHATLKASGTDTAGFSAGTGTALNIVVPVDKKGAFLRRSANGAGNISTSSIQFIWDYGTDGVIGTSTVRVKVFAVEMVYIPTAAFYVGSGGSETAAFYAYPTTTNAYLISSENSIDVGTTSGYLYYPSTTYGGDRTGPIPAAFPKGYTAFYMMKYDISQGQYADFLNTLTSTQAAARYPGYSNYRHTISGSYPSYSASRPDRSCNYLSWADLCAYADWAALRPMTELEFEKACRGTSVPTPNEYAWGNTTITQATTISGTENGTETISNSGANCNYGSVTFSGGDAGQGPLRCGIFATSSSTRINSGAGYYGVMDLSGNLWKRAVTVGNATGRAFTGLNGNGGLDSSGNADVSYWPDTTATGAGLRGGSWSSGTSNARTSDRSNAANTSPGRGYSYGGRCVRTSP